MRLSAPISSCLKWHLLQTWASTSNILAIRLLVRLAAAIRSTDSFLQEENPDTGGGGSGQQSSSTLSHQPHNQLHSASLSESQVTIFNRILVGFRISSGTSVSGL